MMCWICPKLKAEMTLHNEYVPPAGSDQPEDYDCPAINKSKAEIFLFIYTMWNMNTFVSIPPSFPGVHQHPVQCKPKFNTPEGGKITHDIEELQQDSPETVNYRFLIFRYTGIDVSPEFVKDIFLQP